MLILPLALILEVKFSLENQDFPFSTILSNVFVANRLRLAKIGILISMRILFIFVIRPLYRSFTRRKLSKDVLRYGDWCLYVVDDSKSIQLVQKFAEFLTNLGMKVIIFDNTTKDEDPIKTNGMNLQSLVRELTLYNAANDVLSVGGNSSPQIELIQDDNEENSLRMLHSKLGDIASDGGLGIIINFTSSLRSRESKTKTLLLILDMILPYFLFRRTGAIINVNDRRSSLHDKPLGSISSWMQQAISRGVSGFATQLVRSIHFELQEHGIDSVAVTIEEDESLNDEMIVKSTLQSLGFEEELDFRCARMSALITSVL